MRPVTRRRPLVVLAGTLAACVVAAVLVVTRCVPEAPRAGLGEPVPAVAGGAADGAPAETDTRPAVKRPPRERAAVPAPAPAESPTESAPAPDYVFPAVDVAGELPADALGTGPCVLHLSLVDGDTGAPVAAKVRLWRLAVPADAHWTAGEHVQRKGDVPKEGIEWRDLPAGRYLVQADAQRSGAAPIPEIVLDGEATVQARLAMPRAIPVRVVVFDAYGNPIERALRGRRSGGSSTRSPVPPDAVTPREPRVERSSVVVMGHGGSSGWVSGGRRGPAPEIVAGPDGFDLGTVGEGSRESTPNVRMGLQFEGLCDVEVRSTGDEAAKGTFVAFTEPVPPLAANVRLPDGRLATEAGARVTGTCRAVLRRPEDPPDRWRDAVVEVKVDLDGFQTLAFEHRLGEPPPEKTMSPAETK